MKRLTITSAQPGDVGQILDFIRGLAEYERLAHEVVATAEALRETLFGERPAAEVLIAYLDGRPAGFALFFSSYSTFLAQPGIYLEDLFVYPEWRGQGIGRALLVRVAQLAAERGCGRLEWSVLDWNEPALRFYARLGARPMSEWTTQRVTGEALRSLAADSAGGPGPLADDRADKIR
ncbi:MAG: GNAT family N-acetyltransferase [Panacagrimonas sp.]